MMDHAWLAEWQPLWTDDWKAALVGGRLEEAWAFLTMGGPVLWILLGISVYALTLLLVKIFQFWHVRIGEWRETERALHLYRSGHLQEALRQAETRTSPLAQFLAHTLQMVDQGLEEARIREEALRKAQLLLLDLRQGLRTLEIVGSLTPLLGLLGTVLGMIKAFQSLEQAGHAVDPAVLSGGIWEALLTTAVGLAIAIPVIALLHGLEGRVERVAQRMENLLAHVLLIASLPLPTLSAGSATGVQPVGLSAERDPS